jgi:hypothetical protein
MIPHIKNVLLASADQVAIDAMAAKLMGFDPLKDCKYIRLAHEMGLGCGDVSKIEVVGDLSAAQENWHFEGPFRRMTFAASMQHKIYWGRLKTMLEWSLKTWLAPWAYIASVIYHDMYWYPFAGKRMLQEALRSEWGRLFANWERLTPTEAGWDDVGSGQADFVRSAGKHLALATRILGTCVKEAPEVAGLGKSTPGGAG